ncbi:unnamed protein product, partial [Scytosiphon promiscuus]
MLEVLNNRAGLLSKCSSAVYSTILDNAPRCHFPLTPQGNYTDAEPLYARAIKIWEKVHGLEHPLVATGLNNRALLLKTQGKDDDADPLYVRAIAIRETVLGPEHPDVAQSLNNRALLLSAQVRVVEI